MTTYLSGLTGNEDVPLAAILHRGSPLVDEGAVGCGSEEGRDTRPTCSDTL